MVSSDNIASQIDAASHDDATINGMDNAIPFEHFAEVSESSTRFDDLASALPPDGAFDERSAQLSAGETEIRNDTPDEVARAQVRALIERTRRARPASDADLLERAYAFAHEKHEGQKRRTGEPYIEHPIAVAGILAELGMDDPTLAAGLLHDVVEDCGVTFEEIAQRFGMEVAQLVDGVTKLKRIDFSSKQEKQAENLRKLFLGMAGDVRVIIIKLADRLAQYAHARSVSRAATTRNISGNFADSGADCASPGNLAHQVGTGRSQFQISRTRHLQADLCSGSTHARRAFSNGFQRD